MSVFEVRLRPDSSDDAWGRGALSLLAGYLCSLCTFEWSHLWSFSPLLFRPHVALALTMSFLVCLVFYGMEKAQRPSIVVVLLSWIAVTVWPLKASPVALTLWFSLLSVGLLVCACSGPRAVLGLALALMLALTLLSGLWPWPVTAILVVVGVLEISRRRAGNLFGDGSGEEARRRLAQEAHSRRLNVAWKGFAALFKAAVPGEGERFTTRVLADTGKIIEDCGGRRIKGSDLSGTYRFPNQQACDFCQTQLERYEDSIREVLLGIGVPPLQLLLERHDPPKS